MRSRLQTFLAQPEGVDDDALRVVAALMLVGGSLYFFRLRALPGLAATSVGGAVLLTLLWAGFHRLGIRPLGGYWPGVARGMGVALLAFCLMPPGIPWLLAGLLGALAVAVEAVERRAIVPLAVSGVTAAWLLAWAWQARAGAGYIAPFDFHPLDEPIALWTRFQADIEPVRTYAGQVAGPLGATSFGLVAIAVLALSYARTIAWHVVLGFYLPVVVVTTFSQRPFHVYLLDAPALLFVGVVMADPRRLPRSAVWRLAAGLLGGAIAAFLLVSGGGMEAFGVGVAASTGLVAVFQFFGLAGAPGVLERPSAPAAPVEAEDGTDVPAPSRRASGVQVAALALCMPVGLVLVWRDSSLQRAQRRALVTMGAVLYLAALAVSLTWLWLLRLP